MQCGNKALLSMKPRARNIFKALYGRDHESTPPKPEKKIDVDKVAANLAEQFAQVGVTASELARAFERLGQAMRRAQIEEQLRQRAALFIGNPLYEELMFRESQVDQMRFSPRTRQFMDASDFREVQFLDMAEIERHALSFIGTDLAAPDEPPEQPQQPRGTRTGRWTNPDANIRGFRRGR